MARLPLQQQPQRYSSRRDGPGKDHSNHLIDHLFNGEKEDQRPLPHHRPAVDAIELGEGVCDLGSLHHKRRLQR